MGDDAEARILCAVGPCTNLRVAGGQFCAKHAPAESAYRGPAPKPGPSAIVCPHCQVSGKVRRREVKVKRGVSGGKLTGAVLTAGISMLGTGLSRKQKVTEMSCGNCGTVWHVG
jgi:hypothetical protein